jgi:hypothetical protein
MSKKNRPNRRPERPVAPPPEPSGGNWIQFATLVVIVVLAVVSWASWRDVGKLEDNLKAKLGEIETRIKQVSDKVEAVAAAKPQPSPNVRRIQPPDPDKVYEVDIAKAPIRGPRDAPITIATFSDFQ